MSAASRMYICRRGRTKTGVEFGRGQTFSRSGWVRRKCTVCVVEWLKRSGKRQPVSAECSKDDKGESVANDPLLLCQGHEHSRQVKTLYLSKSTENHQKTTEEEVDANVCGTGR